MPGQFQKYITNRKPNFWDVKPGELELFEAAHAQRDTPDQQAMNAMGQQMDVRAGLGSPAADDAPASPLRRGLQRSMASPAAIDESGGFGFPRGTSEVPAGHEHYDTTRMDKLNTDLAAMDRPMSTKQKLLRALATGGSIAAAGIFGGADVAAGVTQGINEFTTERSRVEQQRRKSTLDELREEGGRKTQFEQNALQRLEQRIREDKARTERQQVSTQQAGQFDASLAETARYHDALIGNKNQAQAATLRAKGLKLDAEGNIVPIGAEDMSEAERAALDYKNAMVELTEARKQTEQARLDPNSPVARLVQQRVTVAQQNAATAARRLGLSEDQFEMRAYGTNNGEVLPGAIIGDDDRPVGTGMQQNVRPTNAQRNKADLAKSAREQLQDIKAIVQNRPDIFGPAPGRKTDFDVWVGSQDPDAQRFRAARTIAGDHLAGVFGGRSEAALQALDAAIGQFKDNPEALAAGLDQLDKANDAFVKAGTVRAAGSNGVTPFKFTLPGSGKTSRPPLSSFEKKGP